MVLFKGGLAQNLVPPEFNASFDLRITPKTQIKDFENMLEKWIDQAEGDDKDSGRITFQIVGVS